MPERPVTTQRDGDLDWIKGIACVFMLLLHAVVGIGVPSQHWLWTLQFEVIHQFYAWFFIASGMNVMRSAMRDMQPGRNWRRTTGSYLAVTLALFIVGTLYSMNRRTLGHMDLFQGVAACTAVSYLIVRRRWPSWALLVISVLLFGTTIDYAYRYYGYLSLPVIHEIVDIETLGWPLGERFLFVHFSLLPWISWFLIGAVLFRLAGTKYEKWLWLMFFLFLAFSFLFPWYVPRNRVDFFFRAKVDFLFWSSGVAGISILIARRRYRGRWGINRRIEFIGRESLMIFILQWFIVDLIGVPVRVADARLPLSLWKVFPLLQLITVFGTFFLTRFFAERRDRTIGQPGYLWLWGLLSLGFGIPTLVLYRQAPGLSWLLSFPMILGLGMVFPAVRLIIRRALTPKKPT